MPSRRCFANGTVSQIAAKTRDGCAPGVDQPCREPERLGRRVRVLEAAGVGDEADVQRLGDVADRSRCPASRSRRSTICAVQAASASTRSSAPNRVLSWWWSTLTMRSGRSSTASSGSDAPRAAAVEGPQLALLEVGRGLAIDPIDGRKPYSCGIGVDRREVERDVTYPPPRARGRRRAVSRSRLRRGSRASSGTAVGPPATGRAISS